MSNLQIRPSDVVLAAAQALSGGAKLAGHIRDREYEARRVSQVNRQLTYLERVYQDDNKDMATRQFQSRIADPHAPGGGFSVSQTFGEADWADIEEWLDERLQENLKYIQTTTTNPDARDEMVQHLAMKHLRNRGEVLRQWNVAADREFMAGLNELIEVTLSSKELSVEEQVYRISQRADLGVAIGRLWPDEAEAIKQRATAAAQYSYAFNTAMAVVRAEHDVEAAKGWLDENTPFWDGNPDAREKVLSDVRREFDHIRREHDAALDRKWEDIHIGLTTSAEAEVEIANLADEFFYSGHDKNTWESRLRARFLYLQNMEALPLEARASLEDMYEANEKEMHFEVLFAKDAGEPLSVIWQMVKDATFAVDEDGVQSPRIRPAFLQRMRDELVSEEDPVYMNAIRYIKAAIKDPDQQMAVLNWYERWYKRQENLTPEQAESAARNMVAPVAKRNLEQDWIAMGRGVLEGLLGDRRTRTPLENLTEDITGNRYTAISEDRREYLANYSLILKDRAELMFPGKVFTFFTDHANEYGAGPGATILIDGSGKTYAFQVDDNVLELYGLTQQTNGTYRWIRQEPSDWGAMQREAQRAAQVEAAEAQVEVVRDVAREVTRDQPELSGLLTEVEALAALPSLDARDRGVIDELLGLLRDGMPFEVRHIQALARIRADHKGVEPVVVPSSADGIAAQYATITRLLLVTTLAKEARGVLERLEEQLRKGIELNAEDGRALEEIDRATGRRAPGSGL